MEASYQELFRFLNQLGEKLEELTALQQEKTAAVRRDDLMAVNECMKREQVVSLSLRSMEKKRETLLRALNLEGQPLTALASRCPPELRQEARAASEKLRGRFQVYQSAATVCRNTLELNLHEIEKLIARHEGIEAAEQPGGPIADIRA